MIRVIIRAKQCSIPLLTSPTTRDGVTYNFYQIEHALKVDMDGSKTWEADDCSTEGMAAVRL